MSAARAFRAALIVVCFYALLLLWLAAITPGAT